tara:strand:+ start:2150 stop:2302 length:153 start_codon:yes stop_codon:yes gene_type:complete
MKKIIFIITTLFLLTSCGANGKLSKPDLKKPFDKCPPKGERTLKDILCRE